MLPTLEDAEAAVNGGTARGPRARGKGKGRAAGPVLPVNQERVERKPKAPTIPLGTRVRSKRDGKFGWIADPYERWFEDLSRRR